MLERYAGREVKGVDVVGTVFLDKLNDVRSEPCQDRGDGDNSGYANDYSEHREEAAKLMRADIVQRHQECFACNKRF
jgi:hypothetical protein